MTQTELSKQTGINPKILSEIRKESLTENEHFEKKGRGFFYLPAGVALVEKLLSESSGDPNATSATTVCVPTPKKHPVVDLVAVSMPKNTRIIFARPLEKKDAQLVRVRVADNREWQKNMVMENCTHIHTDYYEFAGRMPRNKKRMRFAS